MTDIAHARRQLAFPVLFVLLWSTGFIAAKYGLPYAPPLTFLLYRFALVAVLMTAVALATGASWPQSMADAGHVAVAAWLVHGLYLGGVSGLKTKYWRMHLDMATWWFSWRWPCLH